jgi:hypothetical protein
MLNHEYSSAYDTYDGGSKAVFWINESVDEQGKGIMKEERKL